MNPIKVTDHGDGTKTAEFPRFRIELSTQTFMNISARIFQVKEEISDGQTLALDKHEAHNLAHALLTLLDMEGKE